MSTFIKPFNYTEELTRIKAQQKGETEEEREKRIRYANYGLIGEERVSYQLKIYNKDVLCFYNLRLKDGNEKAQFDYLIISQNYIFIIEVKNLLGNIIIEKDKTVNRVIYKKTGAEICSMINPLLQIENHKEFLKKYLAKQNCNINIEGILVMGNDKTTIYNYSKDRCVIKYDFLHKYLDRFIKDDKLSDKEYKLAAYLKENDEPYRFDSFNSIGKRMKNGYTPEFENDFEFNCFVEMMKLRKTLSEQYKVPLPYIFTNIEVERLIKAKPKTKEEFMNVPGFKEKRYRMFGDFVINLFKNN